MSVLYARSSHQQKETPEWGVAAFIIIILALAVAFTCALLAMAQ